MSTEANRKIALAFFHHHDTGNTQAALDLLADDCTYWLAGKAGRNPSAGPHTKADMAEIFRLMAENMNGPLHMEVIGTVAEGDKVAVEARSRGELRNGRVYENEYHVLMTIRRSAGTRSRAYCRRCRAWARIAFTATAISSGSN